MSYCCGCPRQEHTTLEHTPLYCTPGLLWLRTHLYHKSKQWTQVDDSEALRAIQVSFSHCHQEAAINLPILMEVLATPLLRYSWA